MHWIDWLIVATMGYGLVTGWWNGLVRSLLNVGALVLAFLGGPVVRPVAVWIVDKVVQASPAIKAWFATVLSYGLIYVVLSVIGIIWSRFLARGALKMSDKLAGMALGGAVSVVVLAIPLALVMALPILADAPAVMQTMGQSRFLPLIRPVAPVLQRMVSGWLHPDIKGPGARPSAPGNPASKAPVKPAGKPPAHR